MKKTLFASTALVAVGLMNPGTAAASDKIELTLGGYSRWWVVGAWNSDSYEKNANSVFTVGSNPAAITPGASYNNVDVKGDNQVWFGGKTTLDNGVKIGVDVHLWAGGNTMETTDTIDKAYVYVEGGFGKFIVGTQKNGTYLLHVQAPDAAGNWGEGGIMTGNNAIAEPTTPGIARVNGMAGGNTTAINTTNNAEAITYVTPTFHGLTLGASYLPHGGTTNSITQTGPINLNDTSVSNGFLTGGIQEVYGVGGLYANTIGGVGVKVSAGAITAKLARPLASGWFEQAYGTQLSYAGFTLGGSFRDQRANYTIGGIDMASAGNISQWPGGSFGNGTAYDLGLQYATGPYAVSLAYYRSSVQHSSFADGHDVIDMYQLSGKMNLGAGVDVLASAGYAAYNSSDALAADHNSGWTVMSGLSLAF